MKRPQLAVGRLMFGGGNYLLCVPLIAATPERLVADAGQALAYEPDLFEWRADFFERYPEPEALVDAVGQLRAAAGDKPILFTTRHNAEDGKRDIPDERKFTLIDRISQTGLVELIDIEQRYGEAKLTEWRDRLHERGVKLVVSHHSFDAGLRPEEVLEALRRGQEYGADIVKLIVRTDSFRELADFSDALHQARETFLRVPLIAGAVGEPSSLMRVMGDMLGSDMTFAFADGGQSHPSQLHIRELRRLRGRFRSAAPPVES